jgi:hypothetical protein
MLVQRERRGLKHTEGVGKVQRWRGVLRENELVA